MANMTSGKPPGWEMVDSVAESLGPIILARVRPALDRVVRPVLEQLARTRAERLVCTAPERVIVTQRDKRWECSWKVLSDTGITVRLALAIHDDAPCILVCRLDGIPIAEHRLDEGDLVCQAFVDSIGATLHHSILGIPRASAAA